MYNDFKFAIWNLNLEYNYFECKNSELNLEHFYKIFENVKRLQMLQSTFEYWLVDVNFPYSYWILTAVNHILILCNVYNKPKFIIM